MLIWLFAVPLYSRRDVFAWRCSINFVSNQVQNNNSLHIVLYLIIATFLSVAKDIACNGLSHEFTSTWIDLAPPSDH